MNSRVFNLACDDALEAWHVALHASTDERCWPHAAYCRIVRGSQESLLQRPDALTTHKDGIQAGNTCMVANEHYIVSFNQIYLVVWRIPTTDATSGKIYPSGIWQVPSECLPMYIDAQHTYLCFKPDHPHQVVFNLGSRRVGQLNLEEVLSSSACDSSSSSAAASSTSVAPLVSRAYKLRIVRNSDAYAS